MVDLLALRDLIEAADQPNPILSAAVAAALDPNPLRPAALLPDWADPVRSVDAALALTRRRLPGVAIELILLSDGAHCRLDQKYGAGGCSATLPLAILNALVAALIAQAPPEWESIRNG